MTVLPPHLLNSLYIRVIEENFDEERQTATAKTIFRSKKTESKAGPAGKKPVSTARKDGTAAPKGASGQRRPAAKSRIKAKKKASLSGRLALMFLLLMVGVAALIGLRTLAGGP